MVFAIVPSTCVNDSESSAPIAPASVESSVASASSVPNSSRQRKPIAFSTASSRRRSRTAMLAVFAAMNTMQPVTSQLTIRNTAMKPWRIEKKFWKKLFSVSDSVSASLLRNMASICFITPGTCSAWSTRAQIMPTWSKGMPFALSASSR